MVNWIFISRFVFSLTNMMGCVDFCNRFRPYNKSIKLLHFSTKKSTSIQNKQKLFSVAISPNA